VAPVETAIKGFFAAIPEARARALSNNPLVKYVEENAQWYLSSTPQQQQTNINPITCDPTVTTCTGAGLVTDNRLWHLDRADQNYADLTNNYSYCTNGPGVTVYVVDIDGLVTLYPGPANTIKPVVSTINYTAGRTLANNARLTVGADGSINIFNAAGTPLDFLIDVAARSGISPFGETAVFRPRARAVSLNVTITGATQGSFLTLWPSGGARPLVSTINFDQTVPALANGAIVGLFTGTADLSVYNDFGNVHVILDVTGYFQ